VERTLGALMAMTTAWRAGGLVGEAVFVNSWQYVPLGRGGHGEGVYALSITPAFVGSLKVFETARNLRLRSGAVGVVYDFSKGIPSEDRRALRFVSFDAGRPFYHSAAGLTAQRRNLVNWIEREITLKRDPIRKERKNHKSNRKTQDAREPRHYDRAFCPLLPEGQTFVAALGHFVGNPEAGFTLYGTASKGGKRSGGHVDGLLAALGYQRHRREWASTQQWSILPLPPRGSRFFCDLFPASVGQLARASCSVDRWSIGFAAQASHAS
jgi:hypothetical protein